MPNVLSLKANTSTGNAEAIFTGNNYLTPSDSNGDNRFEMLRVRVTAEILIKKGG